MLTSIVPINFVAKVIRVLVSSLVTFHFGNEVGKGYLRASAGIVLLLVELIILLALGRVLAQVNSRRKHA